jgi:hypothetical protein
MGELNEGFEWLAKAYQDRCFELIVIKVDPRFDAFARQFPVYQAGRSARSHVSGSQPFAEV